MKVFISWSGEESRAVALALRHWFKPVLQAVEAWMSEEDIGAGKRWSAEIAAELEQSQFGIVCLTRDNLLSPWLLFEAGAIAKTIAEGRVIPYLVALNESEIPEKHPLTQFQRVRSDREGTLKLVLAINSSLQTPLPADVVKQTFEKFWGDLETQLKAIPSATPKKETARGGEEVLDELLGLVRDIHRKQIVPELDAWGESREVSTGRVIPSYDPISNHFHKFSVGDRVMVRGGEKQGVIREIGGARIGNPLDRRYFITYDDDSELVWSWGSDLLRLVPF